jgi:pimeloyl-ACP methyl ester carboxylesterase
MMLSKRVLVAFAIFAVALLSHAQVLTRKDFFVRPNANAQLFVRSVEWTPSRKLPILMVHGGSPAGEVVFDMPVPGYSFAETLAKMGRRVYIMDVRGWGRSVVGSSESTTGVESTEAVGDLGAVVDHVCRESRVRRVILLGHATGGHWIGMYAAQHPGKVAGLIMLNSMYGVDAPWELRKAFEDPKVPGKFDSSGGPYRMATAEGLLASWNRNIPSDDKTQWRDPLVADAYVTLGLATDPDSTSRKPITMRIPGAFRREHYDISKGKRFWNAADLKSPLLYIRGTRDHWSRPEDLEAMKAETAHLRLRRFVTIPDATHFVFLDKLERGRTQMLDAVREFLGQLD